MRLRRVPRVMATWLAVLAMLMVSLAPTLSQAVQSARGGAAPLWQEICSANGPVWINAAGEQAPAPVAAHPLEHCPFCSLHVDAVPGPGPLDVTLAPHAFESRPRAWLHAPRTPHVWVAALPRAPPAA